MLWQISAVAMNHKLVEYMTSIRNCSERMPNGYREAIGNLNIIYVIANESLFEVEDNKKLIPRNPAV